MTELATSADGTRIAFNRFGTGPAVILVGGILSDRHANAAPAEQLARHFTAILYDRRGRGGSGDTAPYAVAREVEDAAARLARLLPRGTYRVLAGKNHGAPAEVVGPAIESFLGA